VVGYALIGAAWLMMKTSGPVEVQARRLGTPLLFALMAFIAIVSIWTPLEIPRISNRWFSFPNILFLAPIPVATALVAALCWYGIRKSQAAVLPFACAVGIFLLAYFGLVISNVPYLVPPSMTVWQAAAHPSSQLFYLIGAAILVPMILFYTVLVFWLFRGKIKPGEGYH
jgi:cytochrome d ubiquinol oxidase subunit II